MATIKLKKPAPGNRAPERTVDRPPVRGTGSGVRKPRPTLAEAEVQRAEREARYQEQLRQRFGDNPPPRFMSREDGPPARNPRRDDGPGARPRRQGEDAPRHRGFDDLTRYEGSIDAWLAGRGVGTAVLGAGAGLVVGSGVALLGLRRARARHLTLAPVAGGGQLGLRLLGRF